MRGKVGIGIITHNRKEVLRTAIERVRRYTLDTDAVMVVADDGSSDGTAEMLREMEVPTVTGARRGIAWNKNRALFLLVQALQCDAVILLEDDTCPVQTGWEREWVEAVGRWGHVNFAPEWHDQYVVSGTGTVTDPWLSRIVTAQCSAFSSTAVAYAGYYDSRFHGFGHEHVEHTRRMIRVGYGGTERWIEGKQEVLFRMLRSDLEMMAVTSTSIAEEEQRNWTLAQTLMATQGYRAPWASEEEMRQFKSEIDAATAKGASWFRIGRNGATHRHAERT